MIFIPPAVDELIAPVNITNIKTILQNAGHRLKSAVAYPVVDIIVAT